jgi:hypothetical protein
MRVNQGQSRCHPVPTPYPRGRGRNDQAALRSGVVALKAIDKKASEHPAAGGTRVTLIPTLPKGAKKSNRPKR